MGGDLYVRGVAMILIKYQSRKVCGDLYVGRVAMILMIDFGIVPTV